MTWDQYWYGDVWMVEAFRRAERHRIERMNQTLWLQGRYFYDALCGASPVFRDFAKHGTKPIPYLEKPYPLFEEEEKESQVKDGQQVTCGGIIVGVKKMNTKSGNMAILTIEDINGTFDVMIFNRGYTKYRDYLVEDNLVTVRGKLSIRDGKSPVVIAEAIIPWEKKEEEEPKRENQKLYLRFNTQNEEVYNNVKKITASYPGQTQVIIKCSASNKAFSFNTKVEINNYLKNELIGLLGEENVIIK